MHANHVLVHSSSSARLKWQRMNETCWLISLHVNLAIYVCILEREKESETDKTEREQQSETDSEGETSQDSHHAFVRLSDQYGGRWKHSTLTAASSLRPLSFTHTPDKQQQTFSTLTDEVLVSETVSSSRATDSEPACREKCDLSVQAWSFLDERRGRGAHGKEEAKWKRGGRWGETDWGCVGELKNLNYRAEAIHLHMKQVAEFRREARCLDVSEIGISNLLSDTSHLASTVSNIYTHMYTHTHTHIIVTIEIEFFFF